MTVIIMEGFDLKASDPTGTSDPYCEVSMGSQEHKTKVIPKTLNPKWNSQMIFTVKDIDQDVLCVTVFDRDFFSPNGKFVYLFVCFFVCFTARCLDIA